MGCLVCLTCFADLLDNMYELVDSLTYRLKAISPSMWRVFELTYAIFKGEAVDFLEGGVSLAILHRFAYAPTRDVALA